MVASAPKLQRDVAGRKASENNLPWPPPRAWSLLYFQTNTDGMKTGGWVATRIGMACLR